MQITIREPGSALTHYIAMMMAMVAAVPLITKAALTSGVTCMYAMCSNAVNTAIAICRLFMLFFDVQFV